MLEVKYRDLPEHGLFFVTPSDAPFQRLVEGILKFPQVGPEPPEVIVRGAVFLNQSGRTIITHTHVWNYTDFAGNHFSARRSDLGSSVQIDALTGELNERGGALSFIMPGSKRLITEEGIYGDNSDVLSQESMPSVCGWGGGLGGGSRRREIVGCELVLDLAIFDDGLCVGPDSFAVFEVLTQDLRERRETARQVLDELSRGASRGQIFELLRLMAQHPRPGSDVEGRQRFHPETLWLFATAAINCLVNMTDEEMLAWFERSVLAPRVQLHRPG